jgi:hypothetical protein
MSKINKKESEVLFLYMFHIFQVVLEWRMVDVGD